MSARSIGHFVATHIRLVLAGSASVEELVASAHGFVIVFVDGHESLRIEAKRIPCRPTHVGDLGLQLESPLEIPRYATIRVEAPAGVAHVGLACVDDRMTQYWFQPCTGGTP